MRKKSQNVLSKARAYLCGAMEFSDGRGWREVVKKALSGRDITFFDPYIKPFIDDVPEDESSRKEMKHWRETRQFDILAQKMKKVRSDDLRCIDIADFVIAVVKPSVASWGSAEEICTAVRQKKPIFLVIDDPDGVEACPLWFFGMIPHKYIYGSLVEAITTIKGIDDGLIRLNSDRWHLLKPELR
jgi:hypothetical protein